MLKPIRTILLSALLTVATASCLTPRTRSDYMESFARTVSSTNIVQAGGSTAYDGVELLRPAFLTGRTLQLPAVYVDGVPFPDVETLRHIRVHDVQTMHYLDASTATIRYGIGHQGGAIVVTTQTGRGR